MENLITIEMIDDWAGAAMQGLVSHHSPNQDLDTQKIADLAYEMAIEMAKARGAFLEAHGQDLAESETELGE